MKISFISGIHYPEFAELGDIYFTLCDWINKDDSYKDFYKRKRKWKITDNMAAENGISSSIKSVINAVIDVEADEVWASDKLYDMKSTIKLTKQFIKLASNEPRIHSIVGIPQGKNMKEWLQCYNWMLNNKNIDVIAISKYSVEAFAPLAGTKDFAICRMKCIEYLHQHNLVSKTIHCAGANHLIIKEIEEYKKYPIVRSIDSNIAFKLGVHKIKIDECTNEPKERLDHNIKNLDKEQLKIIRYNINKIKQAQNDNRSI